MISAKNPRTGEADYSFAPDDAAAVEAAAERLRAAQPAWEALGPEGRMAKLMALADAIVDHAEPIAAALAVDTGRNRVARLEVDTVVGAMRGRAARAPALFAELPREPRASFTPGVEIADSWSAYPLFGAIAPWNFPMLLAHTDAVAALAAGCAALIKPSEITPRFVEPLREAVAQVPEVPIAYVMGGPETGQALVGAVDYVCFTGSTATGRKVAHAAADALIPANLELGGKDPMIITASADPKWAARIALRASVVATGQACQSIERIYVAREIAEPFLAALVAEAERTQTTADAPDNGHIGPFIFAPQAETVAAQIADAREKGASVLTGGELSTGAGGAYLAPTILTDVTPNMAVMREETFGPVLPVTVCDTVEEAITLANDTPYGLSAAVLAGSLDEAQTIGVQLEAGAISLQDGALTSMVGDATNHSRKASGLGPSRMGDEGITRFLRRQALIRRTGDAPTIDAYAEGQS